MSESVFVSSVSVRKRKKLQVSERERGTREGKKEKEGEI